MQQKLIRPAPRRRQERGGKRRPVANHLKAVVGPRNFGRAFRRRRPSGRVTVKEGSMRTPHP